MRYKIKGLERNILHWLDHFERNPMADRSARGFTDGISASLSCEPLTAQSDPHQIHGHELKIKVQTIGDRSTAINQLKRNLYSDVDIALGKLISFIESGGEAYDVIKRIKNLQDDLK